MANILFFITVLFISSCAANQEIIRTTDQQVTLMCQSNSTETVTWSFFGGTEFSDIFTCQNGQCNPVNEILFSVYDYVAYQINGTYFLRLSARSENQTYECRSGNGVQTYIVILIDPEDITALCNVEFPSMSPRGEIQITWSCGYTFSQALASNFTFEGLGNEPFEISHSSQSIRAISLHVDNFNEIHNARCIITFLGVNVTRSCAYPNVTKTQFFVEGNDIIVECDNASDVDWHLFDLDGREEDIENRSWTRDEGRSLLIRMISEEDIGKVVMCETTGDGKLINNGTIIFTVISETSGVSTTPNPKDPVPAVHSAKSALFVLTLLFLALWLITCAVGGVCLFRRREKMKSTTLGISLTSRNATSPNLNHFSNARPGVNEGSGTRGTLSVTTEVRGNPDVSNTNNSAHIPVSEREVDDGDDNTPNRQSNDESHLYFTLEKSPSTMASFRRASTSRGAHGDANPATLDESQSSHWQGYEAVGGSNENTAFSYDLGEYAEVGEHFLGKDPPVQSVRPPIRKKPGREEVKEDDISRLYGKVNK